MCKGKECELQHCNMRMDKLSIAMIWLNHRNAFSHVFKYVFRVYKSYHPSSLRWLSFIHSYPTKLLQKSEMRKVIVIELSYKGFSWSGDNSWSHYNPCRSQILTPQRYLFVTMPENATNGHGGRNKTLRNSELPTTHAKNPVTEKDCAVPLRFAYRHRTLHQLILKPKN